MNAMIELYHHPLAEDVTIENCYVEVADDCAAVQFNGYSTYGRFLFTELNTFFLTHNVFIGGAACISIVGPYD